MLGHSQSQAEEILDLSPRIEHAENKNIFHTENTAGTQLTGVDMFVLDKLSIDSSKEERLKMLAEMDPEDTNIWDLTLDVKSKLKLLPHGTEVTIGAVGKKVNTSRVQHGIRSSLYLKSNVNLGVEIKPFKNAPFLEGLTIGFEGKGLADNPEKRIGLEMKLYNTLQIVGAIYTKENKTEYRTGLTAKYSPFKISATYKSKQSKKELSVKAEIKLRW